MKKSKPDLLHGTLDLLILQTLEHGRRHGWAISKHIRQISEDVLEVNQGSLYPALYRLEKRDWIEAEWGTSPSGRRAKFYRLLSAGRKQLAVEGEHWREFAKAVNRVLGVEPG
ncbi:MAG: PadR family transcriptional regulator [Thermoanaerobaculales bacterium]